VSLLRHRALHDAARDVLVGLGEGALPALGHFLADEGEDVEVRRRIPATLARIPSAKSVELLIASLKSEDEILRDRALGALSALRQERPLLAIAREPIEEEAVAEARRALRYVSLRFNLRRDDGQGSLLDRASRAVRKVRARVTASGSSSPGGTWPRTPGMEASTSPRAAASTSTTCWAGRSAAG
jgi:HEAT repeat protein